MNNIFRPWMVAPPVAVIVAWAGVGFIPSRAATASAEQRMVSAQEARVSGAAQRGALEQFGASPTGIAERVRSARDSVPPNLDVAAFVRMLEQLAIESSLDIEVLAPNGVSDDTFVGGNKPLPAGLSAVSIAIGATGSYDEITDFVENLEQVDRLVLIDGIEITTADDDLDSLSLDLSLRIFTTAELVDRGNSGLLDELGDA